MPEREVLMTREEIERILYQLNSTGKVMASLLIGISDSLDTVIEQNKQNLFGTTVGVVR